MIRFARILATTVLIGLLVAPAALAAEASHPFLEETNGSPPHEVGPPTGPFEDPCGVTIDGGGYRYVADYYHDVVDVYSPSRAYLTQIANVGVGNGPCGLAVDSSGRLYVNTWRGDVVRYAPSSYPPSASTTYAGGVSVDESGAATGIALDSGGNLFVDEGTYIAKYEAPIAPGGTPQRLAEGEFGSGFGIAVSGFAGTQGNLYVADAADRTVKAFSPSGEPLLTIDGAGTPQGGFDRLVDSNLAVDPTDGHILVVDNVEHLESEHPAAAVDEFNASGDYRGQIAKWITHPESEPGVLVEHHLVDAEPSGLAIDAGGKVYVTSGNSDGTEEPVVDKNGKPAEGARLYLFGPTAPARTLEVSRSGSGVGEVTSQPAGIACGTACVAEFDEGRKVTLTATPDSHSAFTGWSGACSGTAACTVTMSADRSVTAEFTALPQRNLTVAASGAGDGAVVSEPAGIDCPGVCAEHFNEGSSVTLVATPSVHNRVASWSGCGSQPTATECTVQMSSDRSVEVSFEPIPQLPLQVTQEGEGTVVSSPGGLECTSSCEAPFDEGSTVTLTATPLPHQDVSWGGCDAQPTARTCSVTMTSTRSVQVAFAPIRHQLSVSVVGSGTVTSGSGAISGCGAPGGVCSGSYAEGEIVRLTAAAAAGQRFAGWSGGTCGGQSVCEVAIQGDMTLVANFAPEVGVPNPPPTGRLELKGVQLNGSTGTLTLAVPEPGTIHVRGASLRPTKSSVSMAGTVHVGVSLNAFARKLLRRSRHHRLTVTCRIVLVPSDGSGRSELLTTLKFAEFHRKKGHR